MSISGRVWKYGDDINTDVIFPGKYTYTIDDPEEMAEHALEDLDPDFVDNVEEGDIIVAGENFGCGSSREQAATCLKHSGIAAIVAKSFSRIYYRNAINNGLPAIINSDIQDFITKGDRLEINVNKGEIVYQDRVFEFSPLPDTVMKIIDDGGLIPHTRKKIGRE